jgi:hypothetical protein
MKKFLIPLILLLVGIGGGVGAGLLLAPTPNDDETPTTTDPCGQPQTAASMDTNDHSEVGTSSTNEYAKLNNQFIVPIVEDGRVSSMVVISLSIEVPEGAKESIFAAEPKLRDAFLQAMFDHANIGGFSGNFTSAQNLRPLREALVRLAKTIVPDIAKDVLIIDIVRQDV